MSSQIKCRDLSGQKIPDKKRDSNLELYRIIVMLLIVAHHYVVNSGLMQSVVSTPISFNSIFLLLFGAWGKTGINCFVLITGYFMCNKNISIKKFVGLLFKVEFYRLIFFVIFMAFGYQPFSIKGFVKAIFPITSVSSNFTGCYLLFYLCIPFLNILVKNMTKKQHGMVLLLLLFVYSILGNVPFINVTMNYVSWFAVLFLIGSYLKLYPEKFFDSTKFWGLATVITVVLGVLSVLAMLLLAQITGDNKGYYFFLSDSNKILSVLIAVFSFMFFKNIKIPYSKFINTVAASTFGVLLIHANGDTMRRWLWIDTLKNTEMFGSEYLVVHAVLSVIAVFAICSFIDCVKTKYIDAMFFRWLDKYIKN